MKALFIEEQAVRAIAQAITFQSGEFDDAQALAEFIHTGNKTNIKYVCCRKFKNWGYIFHKDRTNIHSYVLFDLEKLNSFVEKDDSFIITVLQKVFKFALKRWDNYPLNVSEKIITDNHAILFPFPYTNLNPFKILINLSPDESYTIKRNIKCICVEDMGVGQFDTCTESSINIKNIRTEAERICTPIQQDEGEAIEIEPLQVTELDNIQKSINGFLDYYRWLPILSKKQKDFITRPLRGNERLEGAAGTGKTISLLLKSIHLIMEARSANKPLKLLFICHSISARDKLKMQMEIATPYKNILEQGYSEQYIEITTLQEWCTTYLGNSIGQTELLDADAQECKDIQFKLVRDAFLDAKENDYPTYKHLCSEKFINYINNTHDVFIIEALASEISITIKGRASGDLEKYRQLPRLEGVMPIEYEGDFNFVYLIYEKYQSMLEQLGYFDNDDISLSSSLHLASPIWKRKRIEFGYDVILIDEVHLFSYNELAIFHYLCRDEREQRILYAIDKTQAVGDHGLTNERLNKSMRTENGEETYLSTVFRSSPQIIDLAFSVLTTGAEMFRNFDNPLKKINFSFTRSEEQKSRTPRYIMLATDNEMLKFAFNHLDELAKELNIKRNNILMISADYEIQTKLENYAKKYNKPIEVLKRRGDYTSIEYANRENKYVLGYIDYVGGLEFEAVIMVGIDKGRVPKYGKNESMVYQNYEWLNRLYVAITRAKYTVTIIGNRARTFSPIFKSAIDSGRIEVINKQSI